MDDISPTRRDGDWRGRAARHLGTLLVVLLLSLPLAACSGPVKAVATRVAVRGTAVAQATATARARPLLTPPAPTTPAATTVATTVPASTATVTATTLPPAGGTPVGDAEDAIKSVIQRANQEQAQALTSGDTTVMRDTATSSYYQELVQGQSNLTSSGVTAIELQKLSWGAISLQNATTVQATTVETWRTTFQDGSMLEETDTNVYTLVLQGNAWKIQEDLHPDTRQLQPSGTPGAIPTPVAPTAPVGQDQSRNWAGYYATGGTFTAVSGSWTVPSVSTTTEPAADATWVGIGGVNTHDLIQAGTDATVEGGQVTYEAWVETLPQTVQTVPLDVAAGDRVSVAITQQSDGSWKIVISNLTLGHTYQTALTYDSSLSSAEWIEEAPAAGRRTILPLDSFGAVTFTGATAVEDGQQRTLGQAGGQTVTMSTTDLQVLAQPSVVGTDGSSFPVTRTAVPSSSGIPGGRRRP